MPESPPIGACVRSAAEVNAAIRAFTAGRLVWSTEALAELARLREEWRDAVAREAELAA